MDDHATIELAKALPFKLGFVSVVPAACEITRDGEVQSLEPRIMQVLVVLAEANGKVVAREELVERCWGGRIVGENAVNRVMSRIRHLAASIGEGSFVLETITKVGYRLRRLDETRSADREIEGRGAWRFGVSRRRTIAGAIALFGAAGLGWMGVRSFSQGPSREARLLYAKGKEAQGQLLFAQTRQSVAYFREAVRIAPEYADAWGGLAMSYANLAESAEDFEQEGLAATLRSAAERARAIDPGNPDANVALILITPHFRNWAKVEQDCREGLLRHPGHVRLLGKIPRIMCDTGRWREGAELFERLVRAQPYRTALHNQLALALWGAGRIEDAERAIDNAISLWPEHPAIRATRFDFLALTGRSAAAIATLAVVTPPRRVDDVRRVDPRSFVARALETRDPVDISRSVATIQAAVRAEKISADSAAHYLAALGSIDAAFAILEEYYFGSPPPSGGPPLPRLSRRETDVLFAPATAALRGDPRFAILTSAIGLDAYWHATRSVADWRS